MTDEELQQFADLAKKYEKGKDKEKVKKIISADIHEVFQDINDGGHAAATASKQTVIDKLESEKKEFQTRAEAAEGKLAAFDGQAPDVAKVRKTYEDNEARLRKEYDDKITALEADKTQKLQEKDKELVNVRLESAKQKLVDKLSDSKFKVDKEYAETILVEKPEIQSRLRVDGKNIRVLQRGSQEMFITPAEGKDPLDHLAEELAENVDAKWKDSGRGRGSGTRGSEGGSGSGSLEQRFEQTRKSVQEQEKASVAAKSNGSGLERLGSRR